MSQMQFLLKWHHPRANIGWYLWFIIKVALSKCWISNILASVKRQNIRSFKDSVTKSLFKIPWVNNNDHYSIIKLMRNAQDKSKRPTSASSSMSIMTAPFTGRSSLSRFDFILGIMRGSITSCMAGSVGGSSMSFVKSSSSSWIGKRRLPDGVGAGVRMLFKKTSESSCHYTMLKPTISIYQKDKRKIYYRTSSLGYK